MVHSRRPLHHDNPLRPPSDPCHIDITKVSVSLAVMLAFTLVVFRSGEA